MLLNKRLRLNSKLKLLIKKIECISIILAGESPLTEQEKKDFIDANVSGKRDILLDPSTSSARAAMYVNELCGEIDCKKVVNAEVAKKIGEKMQRNLGTVVQK